MEWEDIMSAKRNNWFLISGMFSYLIKVVFALAINILLFNSYFVSLELKADAKTHITLLISSAILALNFTVILRSYFFLLIVFIASILSFLSHSNYLIPFSLFMFALTVRFTKGDN